MTLDNAAIPREHRPACADGLRRIMTLANAAIPREHPPHRSIAPLHGTLTAHRATVRALAAS
ncbi:hypothetical protein [Nannocystis bainbridge]|uniref:Uncharacterized protein n=1 Tax=Nannocystis bainbridge TaxID=2995303 RepID=A0ABT5DUB5_9BACT|nr:hypothetical protein [Nannocystis bainbridge]MDC0716313.1 hypothetical protein [Nannocystis bainbridge]